MWKFSNPTQPKTDDLTKPETSGSNVEAINVDSPKTLNLFENSSKGLFPRWTMQMMNSGFVKPAPSEGRG
jgi:hypothetical protein